MQKASTIAQQEDSASEALSDKELQDARQVINTFLLAWKNYGLYPEEHAASIKAIENLVRVFDDFSTAHGDLRLTVERDRLLYGGDILHKVPSDAPADDIISLLYRDGIKWFEIRLGITRDELACFFKIAYKYKSFAEETEGDIVTALMDAELEHIDFKAVDIFWQDLLLIDFSQLNTPIPGTEEAVNKVETEEFQQPENSAHKEIQARSIADPSRDDSQLEITYDEYERLQQMVLAEENWDHTGDVFDVLLLLLQNQNNLENFAEVLNFISEEALVAIEQGEFGLVLNLFQSLQQQFLQKTSPDRAWVPPLINRFFKDISRSEIFDLFASRLMVLTDSDHEKTEVLHRALLFFSPEIVVVLVPVLMQNRSEKVQQMLMEVIEHHCRKDIGPLEKLLKQHDTELEEKLLVILGRLRGNRADNILFKMSEHPSEKVRRKAVKELVSRDPSWAQKLFSHIDDPNIGVRTSLLAAAAKQRSTVLENMLLNYLKENSGQKDPDHIFACYKALGRCGSNRAIAFLRRILLNRGWNSFMGLGKFIYREGAAFALALLNTKEARDVLLKASESRFRVVREASRTAMASSNISGENTDA